MDLGASSESKAQIEGGFRREVEGFASEGLTMRNLGFYVGIGHFKNGGEKDWMVAH